MIDYGRPITTRQMATTPEPYQRLLDPDWGPDQLTRLDGMPLLPAFIQLWKQWTFSEMLNRVPVFVLGTAESLLTSYARSPLAGPKEVAKLLEYRIQQGRGPQLRRAAQADLAALIESVAGEVQQTLDARLDRVRADLWDELIRGEPFRIGIWAYQTAAYCNQFFGYEYFLLSVFRLVGGDPDLKVTHKRLWEDWDRFFGRGSSAVYWHNPAIRTARHTRNALVHGGGYADDELLSRRRTYETADNEISITPYVNRDLFLLLKDKVTRLIDDTQTQLSRRTNSRGAAGH